jgi:hypothetical protein
MTIWWLDSRSSADYMVRTPRGEMLIYGPWDKRKQECRALVMNIYTSITYIFNF